MTTDGGLTWSVRETLSDKELQELFSAVYKRRNEVDFHIILANSLSWVSARRDGQLVGFANVIWDGLYHALIVDRAARDDVPGDLRHEIVVKVLEMLKRDYPTVSKVHVECAEDEISQLEPYGFERRTYGRILY
jgi:hypothetical protein